MKRAISSRTCWCGFRPRLKYRITSSKPAASTLVFSVSMICCGVADQHRILVEILGLHRPIAIDDLDEVAIVLGRGLGIAREGVRGAFLVIAKLPLARGALFARACRRNE